MQKPRTRPFVHLDPVPSPLSERSAFPAASSLDTTFEEVVLVEMASAFLVFAPDLWEANFRHRHSAKSQSVPHISFHELDH